MARIISDAILYMSTETLKRKRHYENCSAPICSCDENPNYKNEVVWCPSEQICKYQPYQEFQKKQIILNKLFREGKIEDGTFSANHLEALKISKTGKISIK